MPMFGGAVALISPAPHTFFAHSPSWRRGVNIYAASQRGKLFFLKEKIIQKKNLFSQKILKEKTKTMHGMYTHTATKLGSRRR